MTKKDFFILAIKLFGLYSLITSIFSVIPGNITIVLLEFDMTGIIWMMAAFVVILGLFVLLVFKADKIVRSLKLDKGFDDDRIELENLKSTDVIKIGTFIVGGLMILNNIPAFLSHALFAFKEKNMHTEYDMDNKFNWAVSAINLIIGYLLLTNFDFVAKLMKGKPGEETVSSSNNE